MALYTKCILHDVEERDGKRISVMNRHTLEDGVTPDERITPDRFHIWLQQLSPPSKLVGAYYKGDLSGEDQWVEYEKQYLAHIRTPWVQLLVAEIASMAYQSDITLLCIEEEVDQCHRRLLAEECKRINLFLELEHR